MPKEDLLPYILVEAQQLENDLETLCQRLRNRQLTGTPRMKLEELTGLVESHLKKLASLTTLAGEIRRDAERMMKEKETPPPTT